MKSAEDNQLLHTVGTRFKIIEILKEGVKGQDDLSLFLQFVPDGGTVRVLEISKGLTTEHKTLHSLRIPARNSGGKKL
jgi:hypothetical protein